MPECFTVYSNAKFLFCCIICNKYKISQWNLASQRILSFLNFFWWKYYQQPLKLLYFDCIPHMSFIWAVNKIRLQYNLTFTLNINTRPDLDCQHTSHLNGDRRQYLHHPSPPTNAPCGGGTRAPVLVILQLRRPLILLLRGHHRGLCHPRQRSPGQAPMFDKVANGDYLKLSIWVLYYSFWTSSHFPYMSAQADLPSRITICSSLHNYFVKTPIHAVQVDSS